MKPAALVVLLALMGLLGCKKSTGNATGTSTVTTVTKDCVPGAAGCSEILVQNDPYFTLPGGSASPFNGYADPSIRKDPQSNTLWLSYSWGNIHTGTANIIGVNTHLAKSADGGNTFTFVKELWPSVAAVNATNTSQQGYMESEVSNLLPVSENGTVTWYGARLTYLIYNQNGAATLAGNSFQIKIAKAASPEELSGAPSCILTSAGTATAWPASKNLSTLNSDLYDVGQWNEPALYYENGTLYLALVAFVYQPGGEPNMSRHAVHIFATTTTGDPATWQWSYKGKLCSATEAAELGAQRLTQIDMAKGTDGKLLLVATPDDYNTTEKDYDHKGCKVLEIKSLDNPALERDTNGKLKVRAVITASDANDLGSAASTYDPASSTGLIFTRRTKNNTEFTARIWRTGIKP